jgi:hypothetical protein
VKENQLGRSPAFSPSGFACARKEVCDTLNPCSTKLPSESAGDLEMNVQLHESLKSDIWEIANRLRGPYRPPQYRLVMLPIIVLRRLDCLLEPTKDAVLKEYQKLINQKTPQSAMERLLGRAADKTRKHPLYNTSPFIFNRLLDDPENIAPNLVSYINGFHPPRAASSSASSSATRSKSLTPAIAFSPL